MEPVSSRVAVEILKALPRERITRLVGRLTEAEVPPKVLRPVLSLYGRAYRVNWGEAEVPSAGFKSFNEFFTRRLREGVHRVEVAPGVVVSPADGRLEDHGPITDASTFTIKGQTYDAARLLGSAADAARYAGGHYFIVYLSPRDYHRVHSPVAGQVTRVRHLPGNLYPVNELGVKHVPQLFAQNERVVIEVDGEAGAAAVVMVGAFVVGKIALAFEGPSRPPHGGQPVEVDYAGAGPVVARGGELGSFLLGSTVVVLLPPGEAPWAPSAGAMPRPVRMGQRLVERGAP
ncbi:MAG: phosphatidylserine decarboxylase [Myxococcales bacterium]|nr:phosphatidylserine decarboxylase [Myxococcales bacterium]